jgi:hypothetical protein
MTLQQAKKLRVVFLLTNPLFISFRELPLSDIINALKLDVLAGVEYKCGDIFL